jgi:hypothetical protein
MSIRESRFDRLAEGDDAPDVARALAALSAVLHRIRVGITLPAWIP